MFVFVLILDGVDGGEDFQQVFQAFAVRLERVVVFLTNGFFNVYIHIEVV